MRKAPKTQTPRRKGPKPPPKDSMDALVASKLSDEQITERSLRLARKMVELNGLERRKRNAVKTINADIKETRSEVDRLAEEITHGEEMIRQGDLFAPKRDSGPLPIGETKRAISAVASRAERVAGKDGKAKGSGSVSPFSPPDDPPSAPDATA